MAEFQTGAYEKAAADLESLTLKADLTPQLVPIFFTVGSAYFNLEDYQKAQTAFENYRTKFPSGAHINDAIFGVAQCQLLLKNYKDAAVGGRSFSRPLRSKLWSAEEPKAK
ncbi:MAG: tetratricopeptide repeat protein [Verrucomicrobiota bacterium]|nr:tetratricopeptide repeat protein [Verrucomicrobiota bacterium]